MQDGSEFSHDFRDEAGKAEFAQLLMGRGRFEKRHAANFVISGENSCLPPQWFR
jgi:hypothetical protein